MIPLDIIIHRLYFQDIGLWGFDLENLLKMPISLEFGNQITFDYSPICIRASKLDRRFFLDIVIFLEAKLS